jgi:hypothetical protein
MNLDLFNDVQLHEMDENFYIIPDNTKNQITNKYLNIENNEKITNTLIHQLYSVLETEDCCQLNITKLVPILTEVLKNKDVINYLYNSYTFYNCENKNIFKILYDQIIVKKERNFKNLSEINDFALSWLHMMYH